MIPRTDERPKTIMLNNVGMMRYDEGIAKDNEDIYPGMLIDIDSADDSPRTPEVVKKHATSGGRCALRIATENCNFLNGKDIGDVYLDGDIVSFWTPKPGDRFLARVAANFTGSAGALLQSGGDGTFIAQSGGGVALCQLESDYDLTDWDIDDLDANDPRAQPLVAVRAL